MSTSLRSRSAVPALLARKPGSTEQFFGRNGQINAGSNQEVAVEIAKLMQQIASGNVTMQHESEVELAAARLETIKNFRDLYHNGTQDEWMDYAADVGQEIYNFVNRAGLMRRVLARNEVEMGNDPKIRIVENTLAAIVTTGIGANRAVFLPNGGSRYLTIDTFTVSVNAYVTEKDIMRNSNALDDVLLMGNNAITLGEDRSWINMIRAGVNSGGNDPVLMSGGLSPTGLVSLLTKITGRPMTPGYLVMGINGVNDIITQANNFGLVLDELTKYELLRTGRLSSLYGFEVITDGFRDAQQQVLSANEVVATAAPSQHGGYVDYGMPVRAKPTDKYPDGITARGWFLFEEIGAAIGSIDSFAYGVRI